MRPYADLYRFKAIYFNPRTSFEVRRLCTIIQSTIFLFQSTHLFRGATLPCKSPFGRGCISIHAPLSRCDFTYADGELVKTISIHAPLSRCDLAGAAGPRASHRFQSTHLFRGATRRALVIGGGVRISIHAPLSRCYPGPAFLIAGSWISIHAPLSRCDAVLPY